MKKFLDRIFIDGLTGMAQGLFATLIIGTIIQQIGTYCGGNIGDLIFTLGKVAAGLTGPGIGRGGERQLDPGPPGEGVGGEHRGVAATGRKGC